MLHVLEKQRASCLLCEACRCNQLQGLHLAKVRRISKHMNVHKLGHISVSVSDILLLEGISKGSAFLSNHVTFLGCCLALPDAPDELPVHPSTFLDPKGRRPNFVFTICISARPSLWCIKMDSRKKGSMHQSNVKRFFSLTTFITSLYLLLGFGQKNARVIQKITSI